MESFCPKCRYVRQPGDSAPDYQCPSCGVIYAKFTDAQALRQRLATAARTGEWSGIPFASVPSEYRDAYIQRLPISTTATIPGREIRSAVDVISAECAFGMNLLRDFFASVTDITGGRSVSTQKVLRDARQTALLQLRYEAHNLGANAVVGVDLDYSEFSGGGKAMLFVVASGTAVILA